MTGPCAEKLQVTRLAQRMGGTDGSRPWQVSLTLEAREVTTESGDRVRTTLGTSYMQDFLDVFH